MIEILQDMMKSKDDSLKEHLLIDATALVQKLKSYRSVEFDLKEAFYQFDWFSDIIEDGKFPGYITNPKLQSYDSDFQYYPVPLELCEYRDLLNDSEQDSDIQVYEYYLMDSLVTWFYDRDRKDLHPLSLSLRTMYYDTRYQEWDSEIDYLSKPVRCDQDIKAQLNNWSDLEKSEFSYETAFCRDSYTIYWLGYYLDCYSRIKNESDPSKYSSLFPAINETDFYEVDLAIHSKEQLFEKIEVLYLSLKETYRYRLTRD